MSKPVDLELKKAFLELQVKMIETSKKIHDIDTEKVALSRLLEQVQLNSLGMASVTEGTKTYEAVGRMFLKRDVEKLRKRFDDRKVELGVLIKDLADNKEYLEKNLKESEDNIREMVQLRKEQSEAKAN
ncbi:Prefoldin subunit 1 [Operophtera brumata]|uniref:Prefoldin subunit 1 n=1 Tax=Operophtera brumata TaxID=104452 RepID=A0A0L7L2M7_OPEBR|nr:Prefoldin subunit 1 [Operophtera brumata]